MYSTVDESGRTFQACADESPADAGHASYVFLLDEGTDVHAVPHGLYVALARGEASAPALAGQTLRLADWYVRLKDGEPDTVVNETYSLIHFDTQGRVDRAAAPATPVPEDTGWPTLAERERMRSLLFGEPASRGTEAH